MNAVLFEGVTLQARKPSQNKLDPTAPPRLFINVVGAGFTEGVEATAELWRTISAMGGGKPISADVLCACSYRSYNQSHRPESILLVFAPGKGAEIERAMEKFAIATQAGPVAPPASK